MDLGQLCCSAIDLMRETADFIREEGTRMGSDGVEAKGKHDYVTYVDKGSEERLVKGLGELLPGSGFIAEEGTSTFRGEKYNWVIDPIDGTTNFIHSCPPYAISVALMDGDEVVMGIVYEIGLDECFYSFGDGRVFLNGEEVRVTRAKSVSESLIATGFPYNSFDRLKPFMRSLEYFFVNSHGVRRLGSAATDLAYVACGRYDAFYEYNLNAWDVAAGAFLVEQAGGRVSDFRGGRDFLFGKEIIAATNDNYNDFREKVAQFMNTDQ